MTKQDLFKQTVRAMDRFTKVLEMDFPQYWIDKCENELDELLQKINDLGTIEEFNDFSLTF